MKKRDNFKVCIAGAIILFFAFVHFGCPGNRSEDFRSELKGKGIMGGITKVYILDPITSVLDSFPPDIPIRGSYPSFSPDGNEFAMTIIENGIHDYNQTRSLYIFDYVTLERGSLFVSDTLLCDYASWSPDGSKIAFLGIRPSYFTLENPRLGFRIMKRIFSFFGKKIEYDAPLILNKGELFVVSLDDTIPMLTTNLYSLPGRPSWSPNSKELMFANVDSQIVTIDLSGNVIRKLGNAIKPSWSPDGKEFACFDKGNIYIVDIGSMSKQLVMRRKRILSFPRSIGIEWPEIQGEITWSPDCEYIMFTGSNLAGLYDEYFITYIVFRLKDKKFRRFVVVNRGSRGFSWTYE